MQLLFTCTHTNTLVIMEMLIIIIVTTIGTFKNEMKRSLVWFTSKTRLTHSVYLRA